MKVFVSYSRHDEAAVRSLVDDLERARVQVWIDEELGGGDAWWTAILEQIRGCEVFLFALSDKSLYSKPCRAELGYAQALGLPVLPVQIGQVTSYHADPIFTVQLVDYRDPTRNSAFDLISALHERARLRANRPIRCPNRPGSPTSTCSGSVHRSTTPLPCCHPPFKRKCCSSCAARGAKKTTRSSSMRSVNCFGRCAGAPMSPT